MFNVMRRSFSTLVLGGLLLALPAVAQADTTPEVQRILDAKKTLNWNVARSGHAERYGHAVTIVAAPSDKTKDTAVQYGRYKDFHRKFQSAKVVAKDGDNTDVYMKLAVKVGPMSVDQWAVMRFAPAKSQGNGVFVVEGTFQKGNMKDGNIVITMKPIDAKHTLLEVDMLMVPTLPAPTSMVEEELRDAALDFANGLKDNAQGWVGPVTTL